VTRRPGGAGTTVQIYQRGRKGAFKPLGGPMTVRNLRGYFVSPVPHLEGGRPQLLLHRRGQSSLRIKPVRIFR
jgi:hypothetical protein